MHALFRLAIFSLLLALPLTAASCKHKEDAASGMPPATGPEAPPLPKLPKLDSAPPPQVSATEGKTTGTLFPRAEAQLGPNQSGTIAKILVDEGDRVEKNAVLFRMDARSASLQRDQAQAALQAAQVNLNAVKVDYDRTKSLFEQDAVMKSQWDQVTSRLEAAQVGVEQARVALDMAKKNLADSVVRSPIAGVVTAKLKNEGEMATLMPATIVVVVQDQAMLDLRFRLPERALATVKPGQEVTARFDSIGLERKAVVRRVNPTVDARSRTVELVAEISNPDLALRPGLLAEIQLRPTAPKAAEVTP